VTWPLAILITMIAAPAVAAEPCLPVAARNPDGNYVIPGARGDIVYRRVNVGNATVELSLDAYVQRTGGRRPVVVVIHGGGWTTGSRIAYVGQFLELLTGAGYNWVSIDYRLGGVADYANALDDVRAAVAYVRCQAAALGVDGDRIILLGEDSGAHLAALLAAGRPPGVRGAILVGGFYDLPALPAVSRGQPADRLVRASPINSTPAGMPPLLLVHGDRDRDVPIEQASRYCAAVRLSNVRCDLIEVRGASHRAENWWPNDDQWAYKDRVVGWLGEVTRLDRTEHRPRASERLQKGIIFSPSQRLTLDGWIPPGPGPFPAVVIMHGGGWEAGDRVTYVTPMFEPLAKANVAWFSIDYRLCPATAGWYEFAARRYVAGPRRDPEPNCHEAQLADLRQALRFVRSNAARFRIDTRRIFLLGESASGQMVAQVATEDTALAGVIAFYGVFDFVPMVTDASPRSLLARLFGIQTLDDAARAVLQKYSPLHRTSPSMPPVLLVCGTADRLWVQTDAFARRLEALGVKHATVPVEGAPHGMENWEGHPGWLAYKTRVVEWIRSVMPGSRQTACFRSPYVDSP
jgi:acetyl esterase